MFPFSMGPSMGLQQPQAPLGLRQPAARKTPPRPPSGATENSLTRILSPPRQATPSRAKMQKATLAATHDEAYVEAQDEAGMRWTKRSGFNHDQIRDFQMLLQLIRPIMIKPDKISGSREIAQGSFGTIYSAVFNKRAVAVKRINKDRSKSLAAKMREAYLELNIMNDLSHPNVVQLIGVSAQFKQENPQSFYFGIVLELCTDSLQKALQKKRWPFADRMQMAVELLHGISYIHSMGVLHRDLSSQNILLTSDNHIKIADFGCARKVNDRGEYKSTSITGSPAYMAPEQLEGHVLTLKADMWAVGVNLWELATQKLPWAEEAMRESANGLADYEYCRRKVRNNGKLSRPSSGQLNSSVADGYMQIIQSCHNKDPSKRPSSHDAFSSMMEVLSASSDRKLKSALDNIKNMQAFLAAPDGIKSDTGLPAPELEDPESLLQRRLFKFYRMYNPDKMYEVPQLSKSYADNQEHLNASLFKRYNVDLNSYPLRTPSPFKKSFKNPYANMLQPEHANKFSLADVKKDDLAKHRNTKSIHAMHSINGLGSGNTVETYGGRDAVKSLPDDTVKTWDSAALTNQASDFKKFGYVLPGHEQQSVEQPLAGRATCLEIDVQQAVTEPEKSAMPPQEKKNDPIAFGRSPDRTKTILTLMGTIKLLESKNSELQKTSEDAKVELHKERVRSSELQSQLEQLQQQLRLKAKHEANIAKGDRFALQQDENRAQNQSDYYRVTI